uniref:U6 snRNA-associated Sm-like protein LSm4 n=1 Tax=Glossina morsitans morsitans TaxID=37546 RepID=A0A1B0G1P8_GLOMM
MEKNDITIVILISGHINYKKNKVEKRGVRLKPKYFLLHDVLVSAAFLTNSSNSLVELKNGETYNGHLVSCDSWTNINLRDFIYTSKRMPKCYIRGNTIKYLRIADEVIGMLKEEAQAKSRNPAKMSKSSRCISTDKKSLKYNKTKTQI